MKNATNNEGRSVLVSDSDYNKLKEGKDNGLFSMIITAANGKTNCFLMNAVSGSPAFDEEETQSEPEISNDQTAADDYLDYLESQW